ncbi:lactococcin 972 family bacteriocin [Streptomyces sp. P6-2-1]|uniref:lactococcin 972 family bacteriocin n=1 Tax=Streptomyces sp. P6-2-1 TaxID=3422591 RepID=UPI003D35D405
MKRGTKALAAAAVSAAAALALNATSAAGPAEGSASRQAQVVLAEHRSADVPPPAWMKGPNGEAPTEWGSATWDPEVASSGKKQTRVSRGGGNWNYGTALDGSKKLCFSNYIHQKKTHSASVSIAEAVDKVVKEPNAWAKASAKAGLGHKCSAYWSLY